MSPATSAVPAALTMTFAVIVPDAGVKVGVVVALALAALTLTVVPFERVLIAG